MFFATPNNYSGTDSKNLHEIFAKEAFSKREAWCWLIANPYEEAPYRVKSSLRILAQEWLWPKTKVARFLKELVNANLIETENSSSFTIIKINSIHFNQSIEKAAGTEFGTANDTAQAQGIQALRKNAETVSGTLNGTESQNIVSATSKMDQFRQMRDKNGTDFGTVQIKAKTELETNTGTESGTKTGQDNAIKEKSIIANHNRDKIGTTFETPPAQVDYRLQETPGTATRTKTGQLENNSGLLTLEKEEKKKRSKKRKEEKYPKEKYSLKGIQKERYEDFGIGQENIHGSILENHHESFSEIAPENPLQAFESLLIEEKPLVSSSESSDLALSKKTSRKPLKRKSMEEVEVSDVTVWAEEHLSAEISLEWELAKFQDYYRAGVKNLPKDGVAAFRNWLRKAAEFKNLRAGESSNARHKAYNNDPWGSRFKETTGFGRFLAGGLRAVSSFESN
jgi:hypothetical protein